ncbi:hypothetical protein BB559_006740 [Furculomyces boomerangus]|uniref:G-patch domain-containing protein n=2 Tax=Harpellales TaxID=61421 RepID=A0A2T9Y0Q2_9FUNG|nr:hypothetical protein BB559_006740 [Furculomyces boomerangus]PWA03155.1 hypothetical protein BB558_000677 [Smittium angustum]
MDVEPKNTSGSVNSGLDFKTDSKILYDSTCSTDSFSESTTSYNTDEEYEETKTSSTFIPIGKKTLGYVLLRKMGWIEGSGLGINNQGRKEPVPLQKNIGLLGLGKESEYNKVHIESTAQRRALMSEKLLNEAPEELKRRLESVKKLEQTRDEVKRMTKEFYCELCNKQYKRIGEYEGHLSSYDHNHRKRFNQMKDQQKKWNTLKKTKQDSKSRNTTIQDTKNDLKNVERLLPDSKSIKIVSNLGLGWAKHSPFESKRIKIENVETRNVKGNKNEDLDCVNKVTGNGFSADKTNISTSTEDIPNKNGKQAENFNLSVPPTQKNVTKGKLSFSLSKNTLGQRSNPSKARFSFE